MPEQSTESESADERRISGRLVRVMSTGDSSGCTITQRFSDEGSMFSEGVLKVRPAWAFCLEICLGFCLCVVFGFLDGLRCLKHVLVVCLCCLFHDCSCLLEC